MHIDQIESRARRLKDRPFRGGGPVVYWMSRDQRARDNWALHYAKRMADDHGVPLCVVFCLVPRFLGATYRQYHFMLKGLQELEPRIRGLGIGFQMLLGEPAVVLPRFLHDIKAGLLVADFDPLLVKREWKRRLYMEDDLPFHEVDAHNVVPCWLVASKRISSYQVFRSKIAPFLDDFLEDIPPMSSPQVTWAGAQEGTDWNAAMDSLRVDRTVREVAWIKPGEDSGRATLERFCRERLVTYPDNAMNPLAGAQSDLSPFLHFGQLSAQRAVLEVRGSDAPEEAKARFLDQIVVKRELSDNFCYRTPEYDTMWAFPKWARRSIDAHRSDPREHLYTFRELEEGRTHDPLWNAAQMELVKIGKIHGSLREYWAEKILEWTGSPEEAQCTAILLNNRYQLDANDPSGYTGIAMVIGGLYGRPWKSKDVLGKIRMMTYTEERMNYDVHAFQEMVKKL